MTRTVTRVDESGTPLGEIDVLEAHTAPGILHRAFSVFVFSEDKTELLIQRRADGKPTFGGLWANTCCSHQFPNEEDAAAGMRRLGEELGFSTELSKGPSFTYRADDPRGNGYAEHEHDTILVGTVPKSVTVAPDPKEVSEWTWMKVEDLKRDLVARPARYVPWLSLALSRLG